MINSLSFRKILTICLLAALALGLYLYGSMVLAPAQKRSQNEFRNQEAQYNIMQTNMNDLASGLEMFDQQKDKFERLTKVGFFDSQDRLKIRNLINELQKESRLMSARYTIASVETEENELAEKAGYKIITTLMNFNLEALNDADIYEFIYLMNYGFPGHISISALEIKRDLDITPTLIQKVGLGEDVSIVGASLSVTLKTMVLDPSSSVNQANKEAF